jgi:hypothetical protein
VAEKGCYLRYKISQALLFLERIFLFLDLDCQNLATLDFDNRPISENENSLAEKKLCLRAFLSQYNTFPANRKIYSVNLMESHHFGPFLLLIFSFLPSFF